MRDLVWWFVRELEITTVRATVVLLAVLTLAILGRRWSAALRHRLWCGAIVSLLLLPVARVLLPSIGLPLLAPDASRVAWVGPPPMPPWEPPPRARPAHVPTTVERRRAAT